MKKIVNKSVYNITDNHDGWSRSKPGRYSPNPEQDKTYPGTKRRKVRKHFLWFPCGRNYSGKKAAF